MLIECCVGDLDPMLEGLPAGEGFFRIADFFVGLRLDLSRVEPHGGNVNVEA